MFLLHNLDYSTIAINAENLTKELLKDCISSEIGAYKVTVNSIKDTSVEATIIYTEGTGEFEVSFYLEKVSVHGEPVEFRAHTWGIMTYVVFSNEDRARKFAEKNDIGGFSMHPLGTMIEFDME